MAGVAELIDALISIDQRAGAFDSHGEHEPQQINRFGDSQIAGCHRLARHAGAPGFPLMISQITNTRRGAISRSRARRIPLASLSADLRLDIRIIGASTLLSGDRSPSRQHGTCPLARLYDNRHRPIEGAAWPTLRSLTLWEEKSKKANPSPSKAGFVPGAIPRADSRSSPSTTAHPSIRF